MEQVARALFGANGTVSVVFASLTVAFVAAVLASLLFPDRHAGDSTA